MSLGKKCFICSGIGVSQVALNLNKQCKSPTASLLLIMAASNKDLLKHLEQERVGRYKTIKHAGPIPICSQAGWPSLQDGQAMVDHSMRGVSYWSSF